MLTAVRRASASARAPWALAAMSTSAPRAAPPPPPSAKPAAAKGKGKAPVSSCSPGTKMEGLSIFKDQPDPVALPDDQYPKWLWTLIDKPKGEPVVPEGERNFLAERKVMRAKASIKAANFMKTT